MSPSEENRRGQKAAGHYLRLLLLQVGPYRDKWEGFAKRISADELSQAAICKVIALYLYDTGQHPDNDRELDRKLKDKVSRALAGKGLASKTLQWFEEAFELSSHDARRLHELYQGDIEPTVIVGQLAPPTDGPPPSRHETLLLFEHHVIGRNGSPVRHHTQQRIRSLVDGHERHQYRIDTSESKVWVRHGGTPSDPYPIAGGYYAVDIKFWHPLRYNEQHYLDYWTKFNYSNAPTREFRRASHRRVGHLDMRIEFHKQKLPAAIWWAEWQDYRDPHQGIVKHEEITLDEENSAYKYLEAIEQAVVGFYWEW